MKANGDRNMAVHKHQSAKPARSLNPRGQSCLPCRIHKIQCNRALPCKACVRHGREDACRRNPPPAILGVSQAGRRPNLQIAARIPTTSTELLTNGPGPFPEPSVSATYSSPVSTETIERRPPIPRPTSVYHRTGAPAPGPGLGADSQLRSRPELQSLALFRRFQSAARFCGQEPANPYPSLMMPSPALSPLSPEGWKDIEGDDYWQGIGLGPSFPIGQKPNVEATKIRLASLLPTPTQCDVLVAYFYDHCDFLYRAIHVPTFRAQYTRLWTLHVLDIDLAWLSLLLSVLSVSSTMIHAEICEGFELKSVDLRRLSRVWHLASGQALQAIEADSHPTFTQLQTFIVSQQYCYVANDVESFNSALGRAVRNAQALGLDKPCKSSNILEREMRHRIWWEICHADTFQAMCMARTPLIQSYLSRVPFPLHCNNIDITENSINVRPESEPTDLSLPIQKYRLFKLFNKLYKDNCDHIHNREFVDSIDAELRQMEESAPWFNKIEHIVSLSQTPADFNEVPWASYIIRSCICQQRLRMYRPFLQAKVPETWEKCVQAAEGALDIYRVIRSQDLDVFRRSSKFKGTSYQIFSVATFLSLFLLIEQPSPADKIRRDIDIVLEDLEFGARQPDCHPTQTERTKVLRQILAICDSQDPTIRPNPTTQFMQIISTVFGGETSSRSYLSRERPTRPSGDSATSAHNSSEQYVLNGSGSDQQPHRSYSDTTHIPRAATDAAEGGAINADRMYLPGSSAGTGIGTGTHSDTSPEEVGMGANATFDFNIETMPYDLWQWDQWDSLFSDYPSVFQGAW